MNKFPKWLLVFNSISSTNLRMYLTCVLALGTGVHYWFTNNIPASEWLFFIGSLSGIDVAQFATKRITHRETTDTNSNGSATINKHASVEDTSQDSELSSDVRELSKNNMKG
jgi:hypothetical protein